MESTSSGHRCGYTVRDDSFRGSPGSGSTERAYRIEVWADAPERGAELLGDHI